MHEPRPIDGVREAEAQARRQGRTTTIRRVIAAGIAALALFGLVLGGTVLAQSGGEDSIASSLRETFLNRLAENLGIGREELDSAIQQSAEQAIDEAVANGQLTEEQGAALKERIAQGHLPLVFAKPHRFGPWPVACVALDTVADTLGMSVADLRAELQSGKTLSEIIAEHGKTVDDVVNALVAEAQAKLEQAVADGRLTQEEADEILSTLPDRLRQMIEENRLPGRGWHRPGGPGGL